MVKSDNSLDQYKQLYIKEFLTNHKQYDVSNTLLRTLTARLGLSYAYDNLIFSAGTNEFLASISEYYNEMMLRILNNKTMPSSITERISIATSTRLKIVDKALLAKISQYYLSPSKNLYGLKLSFKTCDQIWHYAGDRSTDYNFYTKRTLLLGVFLPSLLYYLGDNSSDHTDTDDFIDYSLEKIVKIVSIKKQIKIPKLKDIPFIRMLI